VIIALKKIQNLPHTMLIAEPEGKRQLGRNRRRWEDNIKMDFKEIR
jgi:hypothetical protein